VVSKGLATFSIGFDSAGGQSGDEYYYYSDLVAKAFGADHHKIHIDNSRLVPAVPKTIAAMSEPMVSHDCVAFYLLAEEVSKSNKVVQSGVASIYSPEYCLDVDASREFVTEHLGTAGADTAVDAALRLDTAVMLVDDPVKGVDTMTMAWGLEARVPFLDHDFVELAAACPPELKLACRGKGVLKDASRSLLPAAVIDRTKGYFPVPGIRHLDGKLLDLVRDALTNDAARARGLYRRKTLEMLLNAPNQGERHSGPTRCGSWGCSRCGCRAWKTEFTCNSGCALVVCRF
jgi:asparagine synthase (glutamine-hydrolysing)